jgi:RNA recognition motif-containing protein
MSFTVFLGNLPTWVTADDIRGWLSAESLVADAIKVIRNPETQESKGFAFIDAPNTEEMNAIIRRFDRAPLEDRLLRANPAQPPRPKGQGEGPTHGRGRPQGAPGQSSGYGGPRREAAASTSGPAAEAHAGIVTTNAPSGASAMSPSSGSISGPVSTAGGEVRPPRRRKGSARRPSNGGAQTAFAEELAKAL